MSTHSAVSGLVCTGLKGKKSARSRKKKSGLSSPDVYKDGKRVWNGKTIFDTAPRR